QLSDAATLNTISGNAVARSTGDGIQLNASPSNTVTGNILTLNAATGIHLVSSTGNTISRNTATATTQVGIRLDTASNGNSISKHAAIYNEFIGIVLIDCNQNKLTGNTTNFNFSHGIFFNTFQGTSNGNLIPGNTANGNNMGIECHGDSNTFSKNTVINNNN